MELLYDISYILWEKVPHPTQNTKFFIIHPSLVISNNSGYKQQLSAEKVIRVTSNRALMVSNILILMAGWLDIPLVSKSTTFSMPFYSHVVHVTHTNCDTLCGKLYGCQPSGGPEKGRFYNRVSRVIHRIRRGYVLVF